MAKKSTNATYSVDHLADYILGTYLFNTRVINLTIIPIILWTSYFFYFSGPLVTVPDKPEAVNIPPEKSEKYLAIYPLFNRYRHTAYLCTFCMMYPSCFMISSGGARVLTRGMRIF